MIDEANTTRFAELGLEQTLKKPLDKAQMEEARGHIKDKDSIPVTKACSSHAYGKALDIDVR